MQKNQGWTAIYQRYYLNNYINRRHKEETSLGGANSNSINGEIRLISHTPKELSVQSRQHCISFIPATLFI
jgi:hypothetical protein